MNRIGNFLSRLHAEDPATAIEFDGNAVWFADNLTGIAALHPAYFRQFNPTILLVELKTCRIGFGEAKL